MRYVVETSKSVERAANDLAEAVKRNGFGVLYVYDLKQTLAEKGAPIDHECRILEVCNPKQARAVLNADMALNVALPCRVSVYEEGGKTHIGLLSPKAMLAMLSDSVELARIADEVETAIKKMIAEAR